MKTYTSNNSRTRITTFTSVMAMCLALLFALPVRSEPPNLTLLKQEIKLYHDSGAYEQELTKVIDQAHQYILNQVETNKHNKKKLAVVLDIDETSLSNYNKIVARDFGDNLKQIHQEIAAADAPPIQPTLNLYRDALKHGISVFFVTGRSTDELAATKINLLHAGYKDWSGLYLRPQTYHQSSIIPFKSRMRALISHKGYTVIATIGDQYSDLRGGYAQKGFKLPNPFYFLP